MTGKVTLVGSGPGDADLITVLGLRRLRQADVIMHDVLIDLSLLDEAKDGAEIINVGMLPGNHMMPQDEIEATIVAKAKEGKHVVRLKGGDSYVFGRGSEEVLACYNNGVPVEVVPGITSASAALTHAGIPLTHRNSANVGEANGFLVVTGHDDPRRNSKVDYEVLAKFSGTIVILMGLRNLPNISSNLIEQGKDPDTPAALIEWGGTPKQRVIAGTVATLPQLAQEHELKVPTNIVIGEVVRLHDRLPVGVRFD